MAGTHYATYDFPLHTILGIWGIPLYLYCSLKGIDATDSVGCLIYGKSIYIVATVISSILLYKICVNLQIDKKLAKICPFLFCSSVLMFSSVCVIGQSDIIGIVFILLGINAYIKKNEAKFIVWFMVAIPLKMFALFIFVPLLLMQEKKLYKIFIKGSLALCLTILCNLIFRNDSLGYIQKMIFSKVMLNKILATKIPILNAQIPLFLFLFCVLCIWCYLHKRESDFYECAVFVPLMSVIVVFISFASYPYWYCI